MTEKKKLVHGETKRETRRQTSVHLWTLINRCWYICTKQTWCDSRNTVLVCREISARLTVAHIKCCRLLNALAIKWLRTCSDTHHLTVQEGRVLVCMFHVHIIHTVPSCAIECSLWPWKTSQCRCKWFLAKKKKKILWVFSALLEK